MDADSWSSRDGFALVRVKALCEKPQEHGATQDSQSDGSLPQVPRSNGTSRIRTASPFKLRKCLLNLSHLRDGFGLRSSNLSTATYVSLCETSA